MQTFVYKVTLRGSHPPVWRRIEVPADRTLRDLHMILQIIFGWEDYHLHVFQTVIGEVGPESDDPFGWGDQPDHLEHKVKLPQVGSKFTYVYDFGDNWEYTIVLEKILDKEVKCPQVIKWKGDNFMEDIGGVWAANEAMAMAQEEAEAPEDADEEDEDEWDEWDENPIEPFDLAYVNMQLRSL